MDKLDSDTPVYDGGRAPWWVRVPCLLLGVVCLLLLADLLCARLLNLHWLDARTPLGVVPAVLALVLLAFWMIQVWYGRKRIFWDAAGQRLMVEDRLLIWTVRRRIPASQVTSIEVRRGRTLASTFWDIYACAPMGKTTWLTRAYEKEDAADIAQRLARTLERPCLL